MPRRDVRARPDPPSRYAPRRWRVVPRLGRKPISPQSPRTVRPLSRPHHCDDRFSGPGGRTRSSDAGHTPCFQQRSSSITGKRRRVRAAVGCRTGRWVLRAADVDSCRAFGAPIGPPDRDDAALLNFPISLLAVRSQDGHGRVRDDTAAHIRCWRSSGRGRFHVGTGEGSASLEERSDALAAVPTSPFEAGRRTRARQRHVRRCRRRPSLSADRTADLLGTGPLSRFSAEAFGGVGGQAKLGSRTSPGLLSPPGTIAWSTCGINAFGCRRGNGNATGVAAKACHRGRRRPRTPHRPRTAYTAPCVPQVSRRGWPDNAHVGHESGRPQPSGYASTDNPFFPAEGPCTAPGAGNVHWCPGCRAPPSDSATNAITVQAGLAGRTAVAR